MRRLRVRGDEGGSLVEMAMIMPVLLLTITGILTFGVTMNSALELTNGVAVGAQYIGSARAMGISDPCKSTAALIASVAPLPASNTINLTFKIYTDTTTSYTYGPNTVANSTCTAGAAYLTEGYNIVITATSPCTVAVYGNSNILPGCELPASITVRSQ
jgi:Flp pilus assembly protein TadG